MSEKHFLRVKVKMKDPLNTVNATALCCTTFNLPFKPKKMSSRRQLIKLNVDLTIQTQPRSLVSGRLSLAPPPHCEQSKLWISDTAPNHWWWTTVHQVKALYFFSGRMWRNSGNQYSRDCSHFHKYHILLTPHHILNALCFFASYKLISQSNIWVIVLLTSSVLASLTLINPVYK